MQSGVMGPRLRGDDDFGMARSSSIRAGLIVLAALIALPAPASAADSTTIAARQRQQRTTFSDKDIIDGFLKTTFGAARQAAEADRDDRRRHRKAYPSSRHRNDHGR